MWVCGERCLVSLSCCLAFVHGYAWLTASGIQVQRSIWKRLPASPYKLLIEEKIEELFHSLWLASLFRFSGVHIVCSGDIRDFGLFQPAYYCSACVDIADRHISSTKGRNISRSVSIYVICCTISNTNVLKSSIRFDGIWWFVCKDGKSQKLQ